MICLTPSCDDVDDRELFYLRCRCVFLAGRGGWARFNVVFNVGFDVRYQRSGMREQVFLFARGLGKKSNLIPHTHLKINGTCRCSAK